MSIIKKKNEGRSVHKIIKKARGTYRADRDDHKISLPALTELPSAPKGRYSDETVLLWNEIVSSLFKVGLLQGVGLPQITIFCDQFQVYEECQKDLKKNGIRITVKSPLGGSVTKRNPAVETAQMAIATMNAISDRFGFSPLAQARIKTAAASPINDNPEEQKKKKYNL